MVGRPFRQRSVLVTPGVEADERRARRPRVGTGQQWLDFCVMVGHPEWTEDRSLFADRAHLQPIIAAWMAEHTIEEVLDLAGSFRIPHAPIGNGATIPATDHFRSARIVRPEPTGRLRRTRPALPVRPAAPPDAEPAPRLGEHDGRRRGDASR